MAVVTVQQIGRRYGHLMRVCRVLAQFHPQHAQRYINLRHCLWARCTREIRRNVLRH